MNAQEFAHQLRLLVPIVQAKLLNTPGLSVDYVNKTLQTYNCSPKSNGDNYDDELLNLVSNYTANNIVIGQVSFYNEVKETVDYYHIGKVEADWLIIDKITKIVRVVELETEYAIWDCAQNGSKFLDALLLSEKLFSGPFEEDENKEQIINCEVAAQCAELAGGDRFVNFFKMLIGCFN